MVSELVLGGFAYPFACGLFVMELVNAGLNPRVFLHFEEVFGLFFFLLLLSDELLGL